MTIATANGKALFGRAVTCTVGTLEVSRLRVQFKAKKSVKPEPNTCEVKIYNLSRDSRRSLENSKSLPLRLEAGYVDAGTHQIFLGEVRGATTVRDGVDLVTTVTTGDGEEEIKTARIHLSFGPAVPADVALTAIARTLGVGMGNVAQAAATLRAKGLTPFGKGSVVSGNVARTLTDFCRSAGLEWSVQDGQLQILNRSAALSDLAIQLSSRSGLIGSPSVDLKGQVKAKALIMPDLSPGRKVSFQSESVTGGYRVEQVEYSGDTHGQEWYATLDCKKY